MGGLSMNRWIAKSIALANEADYLDRLYAIYPMSVNSQRTLNPADQAAITACFQKRDDLGLLQTLLRQEVFPLKDSYVAYFKRNKTAIQRNPRTVARLTRLLYEMGLEEIFARITAPKETNRQMGPAFKRWLDQGSLGCAITKNPAVFCRQAKTSSSILQTKS